MSEELIFAPLSVRADAAYLVSTEQLVEAMKLAAQYVAVKWKNDDEYLSLALFAVGVASVAYHGPPAKFTTVAYSYIESACLNYYRKQQERLQRDSTYEPVEPLEVDEVPVGTESLVMLCHNGTVPVEVAARALGMSRATAYRKLKKVRHCYHHKMNASSVMGRT